LQHDYESEIEDLMNPKDELKKRIVTLAGTMREWNEKTKEARKSVRKQLEDIIDLGLNKRKMGKTELRNLINEIFQYHGIHQSWLRKLLPKELKDTSKTRLSYQQRQEIEKEQQRLLLQQQASGSQQESEIRERTHPVRRIVGSVSYQSPEPEITPFSSETMQELETEYVSEYDSQETLSSPSKEPVKVQNELSEAYKKIEKLEADVLRLSEQFIARASLQILSETIPVVAHIDPSSLVDNYGYQHQH
jgi:hypothetical protein